MSIRIKLVAVAATLLLLAGGQSQAAFVGTQGFGDQGTPLANGSASGNINTATTLTIGDLNTTTASTGVFTGVGKNIDFGTVTFSTATGGNATLSFTDGTGKFGSFTSTTFATISNVPGTVSFYVLGLFTPGTFAGYGGVTTPQLASLTISFNQTPAGSGGISDSVTLSVPPAGNPTVPEPASIAMVVLGLGGVFAARRYSRRAV